MALDKYKGPERRKYMRLDADCAVDYTKLSKDLKPMYDIISDSYSKNISAAGVKFVSAEKIGTGEFLELHMKIPATNKFIAAIGKVTRCENEDEKNYGIAVSFVWISKRDKELIDDYVRNKKLEELRSEMKE